MRCRPLLSPLPRHKTSVLQQSWGSYRQGHIPKVVMGCRLARGKCILSPVLWRLLVAGGPEPKLVNATSSWISADGCPFCNGPPGNKGSGVRGYPKTDTLHTAKSSVPMSCAVYCPLAAATTTVLPVNLNSITHRIAIPTDIVMGLRGRLQTLGVTIY